MAVPGRLEPLLEQYDFACLRLVQRLGGPFVDSGNGLEIPVPPLTDAEFLWEPVPGAWSVRPRAAAALGTAALGTGATVLVGAGEWGRETAPVHPVPPPFTTLAWRLGHLAEMLALRAEYTVGGHRLTRDDHVNPGDAVGAVAAFEAGARAWREALLAVADDATLDKVGHSTYPNGSDAEERFLDVVWWVNQEVLHHGAEIALLRDLYREWAGRPDVPS
ncbi:DinB family protein [Streptacidiphilus jiangxiensis]|uniref:DinB superfamily protein n=1 Tax=Streptacidiphilus jiangxiensis TaxID=235985 RepID=A0A1H7YF63_STRJI|nr:DinB family protein [Streptacidiphilus jiangxiensis]SEM44876.1 DinB superfamily protein [Streptacidiphilus jiangxiensis]